MNNETKIAREGDIVTVRELIEALEKLPPDCEIVIVADGKNYEDVIYADKLHVGKNLCAIMC